MCSITRFGSCPGRRVRVGAVACLLSIVIAAAKPAAAEVLMIGEGEGVVLDIRDAPRRDVFETLFAGRGIQLDWLSRSYGDEVIRGRYQGTIDDVARAVLAGSNFVIVYDSVDKKVVISRILFLGTSPPGRASPGLSTIVSAMQPGSSEEGKALTVEQLRSVAISSEEYLRRIERLGTWQLDAARSFQLQLGRTAGVTGTYDNLFPGENSSAGLPLSYVPRPETDPVYSTEYAQALTLQMAVRGLSGLQDGLKRAQPLSAPVR